MASFGGRGAEALAAHRQAQGEEAARLRSLRAAGVEDEATLARSVVQHMVAKEGAMLVIADEGEQEADEDDVELVGEHAFDKRMLSANPAYEQD